MKENWYEEFIESKGLMDEYKAFKEAKINGCNGIVVDFNVMLGDADGKYKEEVFFPKRVLPEFIKYFDAKGWGKEPVELMELCHEFIPGASIYSDQILNLFKELQLGKKCSTIRTESKHSYARFNYTSGVADVNEQEWVPYDDGSGNLFAEIEEARDAAEDLQGFFIDMYFRYVIPFIKEDKFNRADSIGTYCIYAS